MELVLGLLRENWLSLLVIVGLVTAALVLRTQGSDLASTDEFDVQVRSNQATVVEFYSNT